MRYRCHKCKTEVIEGQEFIGKNKTFSCPLCGNLWKDAISDTAPDRLDVIRKRAKAVGWLEKEIEEWISAPLLSLERQLTIAENKRLDRKEDNSECGAFNNVEIHKYDYPCSMCSCGYNDGQPKPETCYDCNWHGCDHPECPVTGCMNRSEDMCLKNENKPKECKDCNFPLNYKKLIRLKRKGE